MLFLLNPDTHIEQKIEKLGSSRGILDKQTYDHYAEIFCQRAKEICKKAHALKGENN